MATITNTVRWADNTEQLKQRLLEGIGTIDAMKSSVDRTAAALGGEGLFRAANQTTAAVMQLGGANKLSAAEQERVNAQLDRAIVKYRLMGKEPPAAMIELANATKKAETHTITFAEKMDRLKSSLSSFASGAMTFGLGLSAMITAPIVAAGAAAIKFGVDAVESENLVSVSFGDMRKAADDWSKNLSASLGLNEFELRKTSATLFNMTTSMGIGKAAAFDMSTGVVKLAADMASFRNIGMDEALAKIKSGLVGESEPLKAIGILVDENTVKTYAYKNGIAAQGSELTNQQKVMARWGAILQQTANDQGDLARTLDSPANQLRIMKSRVEEAATSLGVALIPMVSSVIGWVSSLVPYVQGAVSWFSALPEPVKLGGVVLAGLAAAVGPVLLVMGSMTSAVTNLIPLYTGLTSAFATAAAGSGGLATGIGILRTSFTSLLGVLGPIALAVGAVYAAFKIGETQKVSDTFEYLGLRLQGVSSELAHVTIDSRRAAEAKVGAARSATDLSSETEKLKETIAREIVAQQKAQEATIAKAAADARAKQEAKAHDEALRQLRGSTVQLTDAQKAIVHQWLAQGASADLIAKAYGLNKLAVDAYVEAYKRHLQTIAAGHAIVATTQTGIGHSIALWWKYRDAVSQIQAVHTTGAIKSFADLNTQVGLMPVPMSRLAEHTKALAKEKRDAAVAAKDWGAQLSNLAQGFAQLAQASDGSLGAIARWVGQMLNAVEVAKKAGSTIKAAFSGDGVNFGQLVGGIAGAIGAMDAATSSGSKLKNTLGGAITGMQIGAQVAGPFGAAIGAAGGAIFGFVRNLFGVSKEVQEARKAVDDFQASLASTLTSTQQAEAGGEKWKMTLIAVRDAYLATGRTAAEADAIVKQLWDTDHPDKAKAAIQQINAVLDEQKTKAADAAKQAEANAAALKAQHEDLVTTLDKYGVQWEKLPESIKKARAEDLFKAMDHDMKILIENGFSWEDALGLVGGKLTDVQKQILGMSEETTLDFKKMEDTAKRYGVDLAALGPQFQSAKLHDAARQIFEDFTILTKGGADVGGVLFGMREEISQLVNDSRKFGVDIPANMRPMIEELQRSGNLVDENGEKLTDLSGINFAEPITKSVDRIILKLEEFIQVMSGKVPGVVASAAGQVTGSLDTIENGVSDIKDAIKELPESITIDVQFNIPEIPTFDGGTVAGRSFANEGMVSQPTFAIIGDAPEPEFVLRRSTVQRIAREGGTSNGSASLEGAVRQLSQEMAGIREDNKALRRDLMRSLPQAMFLAARDGAAQRRGRR